MSEGEELDKQISQELKPYLSSIKNADKNSNSYRLFKAAFMDFDEQHERTSEIRRYAMRGILAKTSAEKDNIQWLFSYLGLVETLGAALADMLIMLVVSSGLDFKLGKLSKYVHSSNTIMLKDLKDDWIPLGAKVAFLKENKIEIVSSIIDTETRNKIAHMDFEIEGRQVMINGKTAKESLIQGETNLLHAHTAVTTLLAKLVKN